LELLSSLDAKRGRDPRVQADHYEADGWIKFHLLMRRQVALERLRLVAGDIVEVESSAGRSLGEVISITSNGRVHFKGGHGASAWPDKLTVRCRNGTNTKRAQALRKEAANQAAHRSKATMLSQAKELEIEDFKVIEALSPTDIERLQKVIDGANDEKPIQGFLETRPHILAALLTGRSRFVVPRPQFGSERIPDFLLGDIDSLGIRWLLVELETPASAVTLRNHTMLEKRARKGVSQIEEWREWIQDNLEKARRPRREGGLGLVDIRPRSQGIVLVGRRERLLDNAKTVRNPIREANDILVHTYDWLIERLSGCLNYKGIPALNPNAIHPLREERPLMDLFR
jgi:hypothetical protein